MRENNKEFDFGKLWAIFKNNWIVIVICAVVLGAVGFAYTSLFVSPTYSAKLLLCVSNTTEGSQQYAYYNQTDIIASNKLVNACREIITSERVLSEVIEKSGLDYSVDALRSMISISSDEENQIFKLTVLGPDPDDVANIANTIAEVSPEKIGEFLKPSSLMVIDHAVPSYSPVAPSIMRNTLVFVFLGFVLAYAFFFLRLQFDIYVRSEDDVKELFGDVAVLGTIPLISGEVASKSKYEKSILGILRKKYRVTKLIPSTELLNNKSTFFVREAYKDLRTNILFSLPEAKCKVIAIASSVMSEGKSTTCINTAITFAEMGKRVLVIDTDMRRPRLHRLLKSTATPGLSNLLLNLSTYDESVFATNFQNLDVIFAGDISPNPTELLSSGKMKEIIDEMSKHYEYIFVDTPAIAPVSDTAIISKLVSGLVIVTRQGVTEKKVLEGCVERMLFSNAKILGFVINGYDCSNHATSKYKYNYKYREEYK